MLGQRAVLAALVAVVAALMLATPAAAGIESFSIDPEAVIDGDDVTLTGVIDCEADQVGHKIQIHGVRVTAPGYVGTGGSFRGVCTGTEQPWEITTRRSRGTPQAGTEGTACLRVRTYTPGDPVTDERRVCERVTLIASA